MVFWWDASDFAIQGVCWAGAGLSVLLVCGRWPRLCLALLYLLYLSLFYGGQVFMAYQWDTFLLETGFVALLLSFATMPGVWLLRWLLFRFMFMSGVVKLASGDPNWWGLSALDYHFVTQPLPTPLAWYAAQLPDGVLRCATGLMLVIELVLPFLIFCPRRMRFVAAFGILALEVCIFLTGNYNWFNLQTMLLCLPLFDDAALRWVLPSSLAGWGAPKEPRVLARSVVGAVAVLIVVCGLVRMEVRFGARGPAVAQAVADFLEPLRIVNTYGLFAVMTTERDEIVVEGSEDGVDWRAYEFRYKPGDVARRPLWNVPHQPRLDWQMWFAALDDVQHLAWFWRFVGRLLENEPAVTALLERNPFPDHPPRYVRAEFYRYTFAGGGSGAWWERRRVGVYLPPVQLRGE
jgi:hypothetical protein